MNFSDVLTTVISHPLVKFVGALLIVNVIMGIAVALYTKTFRLGTLADWLVTRAVPMLLAAAGVQMILMFTPGAGLPVEWESAIQLTGTAVWGMAILALIGKIFNQLAIVFPKLPIPDFLKDRPVEGPTTPPPPTQGQ